MLRLKLDRVLANLRSIGVDACILTNTSFVKWLLPELHAPPIDRVAYAVLLDVANSNCIVYVPPLEAWRAIDLYGDSVDVVAVSKKSLELGKDIKVVDDHLADVSKRIEGFKRIGCDSASFNEITRRFRDSVVVLVDSMIRRLRRNKMEEEIERIKKATEIAERALLNALNEIRPGMTELEIVSVLERELRRLGSRAYPFNTIVAVGKNAAYPHHVPCSTKFEGREPILIDFGAWFEGYVSDITRMIIPKSLGEEYVDVVRGVEAVMNAISESLSHVHGGVKASELDGIARSVLERYGYDKQFIHGLGHGVGVDVHEEPAISPTSRDVLEKNDVVTIEPGIYLWGRWGVRIEELVVVKENGAEKLTKIPQVLEV